jgi:drug/metabolite transporter (DMT)-like permease
MNVGASADANLQKMAEQSEVGEELPKDGAATSADSHWLAYGALAAVSFFWGTTYLGIRMSLESFPPFWLIAVRYTISGALMLTGARIAGARIPRGRELAETALFGIISIGIGNGALSVAELWIPSGLASLFITTSPFWMVGIDWALPGGKRPGGLTVRGLLVGLCGVIFLVGPSAVAEGWRGNTMSGFLLLQLGSAGWLLGALLQRRQKSQAHPIVSGAVQQLATGLFMVIPALLFEHFPAHVERRPVIAVAYLIVFGSLVGYSSFVYAMAKLPVAIVSIYTYINPIVAVFLGWVFYREHFGIREMAAMCVIFLGVAIVKWASNQKPVSEPCEGG